MSLIPTPEEAYNLVSIYNKEEFHLQHAKTVSKVMGEIAKKEDAGNEDYWRTVGMLHDIDFEIYPEEHCKKAVDILKSHDVDANIIRSVCSHGYGICVDIEPIHIMDKYLYACDELTGLIGAAALMRPTGIDDMEPKSVIKKFKDKKFAAGCSREVIRKGAEMIGISVNDLIAVTLEAMKA